MPSSLLLVLFALTACIKTSASQNPCFTDPSQKDCADASQYYPDSALNVDLDTVCSSTPWSTGCSLRRQCRSGTASGKYCEPWNVMSSVCRDKATAAGSGCARYTQLCIASQETVVTQCVESMGMPDFLFTDNAIDAMIKLCDAMPTMQWCIECTERDNPAVNCKDPLSSISSICLDHYMEDCRPWYVMCKLQPAGVEAICGMGGDNPVGADGEVCFGQMKMYFHNGLNDYVLFETWIPCTHGRYAGVVIALLLTGIFTGFLKGVRARLEQRWLLELSTEPVESEASWGMLPKGKQRWMNCVRMVLVFVVVTFDYGLMLAAMTFNTGIFFAGVSP